MSTLSAKEYKCFEDIKRIRPDGSEYWAARELAPVLDYAKWENFYKVIKRAMIACENSGRSTLECFPEVRKTSPMPNGGVKDILDYRTLPLVPEYRRLLLQMKKHQEEYRELCGNCYHESDYIYVNDIGEQIKPNYVTQHFKLVLRKNNLREITFHELRHTCASLLLKSGISMKDIQAWLGHSNYNTTANIYAHLESNSKELTGNAMQGNLTISGNLAAMQE